MTDGSNIFATPRAINKTPVVATNKLPVWQIKEIKYAKEIEMFVHDILVRRVMSEQEEVRWNKNKNSLWKTQAGKFVIIPIALQILAVFLSVPGWASYVLSAILLSCLVALQINEIRFKKEFNPLITKKDLEILQKTICDLDYLLGSHTKGMVIGSFDCMLLVRERLQDQSETSEKIASVLAKTQLRLFTTGRIVDSASRVEGSKALQAEVISDMNTVTNQVQVLCKTIRKEKDSATAMQTLEVFVAHLGISALACQNILPPSEDFL